MTRAGGRHTGGNPCLTFIHQNVLVRTRGTSRPVLSDVQQMKRVVFFLMPLALALPASGQARIVNLPDTVGSIGRIGSFP